MTTAEKLDLYKTHKSEYVTPRKPALVQTGPALYLAIDGQGAPGGPGFADSFSALYGAAFTMKMTSKFAGCDYRVCGLEGLWWTDQPDRPLSVVPQEAWRWTLLIRTPEFVTSAHLRAAVEQLRAKGKGGPLLDRLHRETLDEGLCVQVLHVGPYDAEEETIAAMEAFAKEQGLVFTGRHHELYLSDPRRVPPERLKTILRRPVRRRK